MDKEKISSIHPILTPLDKKDLPLLKKTDPSSFQEFLNDASRMKEGRADAVSFPQTEKQMASYLSICHKHSIPVTPAGNHTGLVGGAIPLEGEVLATSLFTQIFPEKTENILEIIEGKDEFSQIPYQFYLKHEADGKVRAVIPPGLRLGEFQKRISDLGYFYGPDPTETNAFLGATVATNASGARTFKYGATRAHVQKLRLALATGDLLEIERGKILENSKMFEIILTPLEKLEMALPYLPLPKTKNAAGYFCQKKMDLLDLWIGSEGTLGVFTRIELDIQKKPQTILSGIAFFKNDSTAIDFVKTTRELSYKTWNEKNTDGIDVRALEYFDSHCLDMMRKNNLGIHIPTSSQAAIYFEQESRTSIEQNLLEEIIASLLENKESKPQHQKFSEHPFIQMLGLLKEKSIFEDLELAFPNEEKAQKKLKEFRHLVPVTVNEIIGHHKRESGLPHLSKVATDTAVPDEYLSCMMKIFKETLEASDIQYVIFGHIGNNHLHANLLPKNEMELQKAKETYHELCRYAVSVGGTVSAEHGIGKLKQPSLQILYGKEGMQKMAQLKKSLDPKGILGRGNIFPVKMLF